MKLGPVTKIDTKKQNNLKKFGVTRPVSKLGSHCHFSNLWPIWIYPETAVFWSHSLYILHFHQQ